MLISVIICSHNPRDIYLTKALDALKIQDFPTEQWEILLVDNASKTLLSKRWDLTWHPNGRHIHEETLGLTHARLCGIKETTGSLLVFVDDDNVLEPDYLSTAWKIANEFSYLGAWGGNISGDFETPVADWVSPHLWMLGIRQIEKKAWGCSEDPQIMPIGAGICLRRIVAEEYMRHCSTLFHLKYLDRRGTDLASAGDNDMCLTACHLGLGIGVFPELNLTHLIPSSRLTLDYLTRLNESMHASWVMLRTMRSLPVRPPSLRLHLVNFIRACLLTSKERRIFLAGARGHKKAFMALKSHQNKNEAPLNSCHI